MNDFYKSPMTGHPVNQGSTTITPDFMAQSFWSDDSREVVYCLSVNEPLEAVNVSWRKKSDQKFFSYEYIADRKKETYRVLAKKDGRVTCDVKIKYPESQILFDGLKAQGYVYKPFAELKK